MAHNPNQLNVLEEQPEEDSVSDSSQEAGKRSKGKQMSGEYWHSASSDSSF